MRRYHIVGVVILANGVCASRDLVVRIKETDPVYDDWCKVMTQFLHQQDGQPVDQHAWHVSSYERLSDCEASD